MAVAVKSPSLAFAVERLRKSPDLVFGDLKKEAEKRGLKMVPIVYGRAKLALGIAKKRPHGRAAAKPAGAGGSYGKSNGSNGLDSSLLKQIETLARDARSFRNALGEIRTILARVV